MSRLMVRCPTTSGVSFTGLIMDEASFSNCGFVMDREPHVCPFCSEVHSYESAYFFLEDPTDEKDVAAA